LLFWHFRFISASSGGGLREFSRIVRATIRGNADVRTSALETTLTVA